MKVFEKLGTIAGWITALIQIPIWLYWIPYLYTKKRKNKEEIDSIIRERDWWKEECYKMKDIATSWHQITKEAVSILRHSSPMAYKDFIEAYGGEEKIQDWYELPEIPKIKERLGQ